MHGFKVGDRVLNGASEGVVVGLIADDVLSVIYDDPAYEGEPQQELAAYFEHTPDIA